MPGPTEDHPGDNEEQYDETWDDEPLDEEELDPEEAERRIISASARINS